MLELRIVLSMVLVWYHSVTALGIVSRARTDWGTHMPDLPTEGGMVLGNRHTSILSLDPKLSKLADPVPILQQLARHLPAWGPKTSEKLAIGAISFCIQVAPALPLCQIRSTSKAGQTSPNSTPSPCPYSCLHGSILCHPHCHCTRHHGCHCLLLPLAAQQIHQDNHLWWYHIPSTGHPTFAGTCHLNLLTHIHRSEEKWCMQ